jgi:hypothetical protein
MTSRDFPLISDYSRQHLNLGELLTRVDDPNGQWTDMPTRPGIYLVLWPIGTPLRFREEAEAQGSALDQRWLEITNHSPTDILYLGQGNSLRNRVRQLARFGCGHATDHQGGQDLWWIEGIGAAEVLIQTCPDGKQTGFENEALERYFQDHGHYPLANRQGPRGSERWWPDA